MPRQEVAFGEKARKIKGCGSLEGDFYTKFKPENKGFGVVAWRKKRRGICFLCKFLFMNDLNKKNEQPFSVRRPYSLIKLIS